MWVYIYYPNLSPFCVCVWGGGVEGVTKWHWKSPQFLVHTSLLFRCRIVNAYNCKGYSFETGDERSLYQPGWKPIVSGTGACFRWTFITQTIKQLLVVSSMAHHFLNYWATNSTLDKLTEHQTLTIIEILFIFPLFRNSSFSEFSWFRFLKTNRTLG